MPIDLPTNSEGQRIDSWKEIAAFFGRDERTVKRWEKERGLPVHRVPGGSRGTVYAFTVELTAWLRSSQQKEDQPSSDSSPKIEKLADLVPDASVFSPPDRSARSLPGQSPKSSKAWWLVAVGMVIALVLLTGFPRFFQLRSVQGRVLPSVSRRTTTVPHKEAEDLYLQGRYHWNKRTPDGLTEALDDFTKATQLDPNYALAYAGQADCYNLLREYTNMPASQAFPLAINAATKAVELDDNLPEAHRALGFASFWWNWDIPGGERQFKRAIALNPNDVETHHWYATALMTLGRYPEAMAEIERARQLDPTSSSIAADRAVVLYGSGRTEEAFQILLDLEKSEPNFRSPYVYLSMEYFEQKRYEKSFDQAEMAARLTHDNKTIVTIQKYRARLKESGEKAMLEAMLAEQLLEFNQGDAKALEVAKTSSILGEDKQAMDYLQKAYQRHEYELITLSNAHLFGNLRQLPEFQDLVKRINGSSHPQG